MDDCFPFSAAIRLPRVLRCVGLGLHLAVDRRSSVSSSRVLNSTWRQPFKFGEEQGCSGAGTRGTVSPTFFDRGRVPHSLHFFGLKFVQKLVHCCNWLLAETECKIISLQQN